MQHRLEQFFRANATILLALIALQIVVYSYFYFGPILTNHTFPNAWVVGYPSFKTLGEGRWLADLVILVQGSSGVQSLQMFVATALQAVNGVLFARLCGLTRPLHIGMAAALLCLYPAFLDYYVFNIDHLTFVLGDTLALLGLRAALQNPPSLRALGRPALFFMLAIACYQPKIALVATLCVIFFALSLTRQPASVTPQRVVRMAGYAIALAVSGLLLYYLSMKLTVFYDIGQRAYMNTPAQILAESAAAYGHFLRYFWTGSAYLPPPLLGLPLIAVILGGLALLPRLAATRGAQSLALLVVIVALPLALRASYIINETTWDGAGRINFAYGYALIFFLICLLQHVRLQKPGLGLIAVLAYFSAVADAQETNAAAMKTEYDTAMINRIAARIEAVTPDLLQTRHPIAIFGHYPAFPHERYLRSAAGLHWVHSQSATFEVYRQTEILNFFFGRDVVHSPTTAQLAQAAAAVKTRPVWPAPQSVFVQNGTIIVLLEPYTDDLPRTWAAD